MKYNQKENKNKNMDMDTNENDNINKFKDEMQIDIQNENENKNNNYIDFAEKIDEIIEWTETKTNLLTFNNECWKWKPIYKGDELLKKYGRIGLVPSMLGPVLGQIEYLRLSKGNLDDKMIEEIIFKMIRSEQNSNNSSSQQQKSSQEKPKIH